jgi:hypothetical protein
MAIRIAVADDHAPRPEVSARARKDLKSLKKPPGGPEALAHVPSLIQF